MRLLGNILQDKDAGEALLKVGGVFDMLLQCIFIKDCRPDIVRESESTEYDSVVDLIEGGLLNKIAENAQTLILQVNRVHSGVKGGRSYTDDDGVYFKDMATTPIISSTANGSYSTAPFVYRISQKLKKNEENTRRFCLGTVMMLAQATRNEVSLGESSYALYRESV